MLLGSSGSMGESPPHMRGKERGSTSRQRRKGITPAHAGKSPAMSPGHITLRDHPRTCGEKGISDFSGNYEDGSPPHMRGKALFRVFGPQMLRITPAHAGKRLSMALFTFPLKDHPRTCGEKTEIDITEWPQNGSPPHMRGKERPYEKQRRRNGITPAHAGKRLKRSRSIVPHAAIVPLFPSVCNKPAGSDGSPAGHDAPPFLPIENAAPASPAYNLRSL